MTIPGRVSVEPRAIRTVIEATAAETFHASPKKVRAHVQDHEGGLEIEIATPYGGAEPMLGAAARARDSIATRCASLTGAEFGRVRIRITELIESEQRRVR